MHHKWFTAATTHTFSNVKLHVVLFPTAEMKPK